MSRVFESYAPEEDIPFGGYLILIGVWSAAMLSVAAVDRGRVSPWRSRSIDAVAYGLATHKLARLIAGDRITIPLRAPFVRYVGSRPGGEVNEQPRGRGLQRAIGELLVCPYCASVWASGLLMAGLVLRPATARMVVDVFAAGAVANFLHRIYGLLRTGSDAFAAEAEHTRAGNRVVRR